MTAYMLSFIMRVVLDTNIFVSALLMQAGAPRAVLRLCLLGKIQPLMGNALFQEYEDVCSRDELFSNSPLTRDERIEMADAFFSVCRWVSIHFLWRPHLRDEADNHLVELAIAGNAEAVVTANQKDFTGGDLKLTGLDVLNAGDFLHMLESRK